jgi:hypothetical protein
VLRADSIWDVIDQRLRVGSTAGMAEMPNLGRFAWVKCQKRQNSHLERSAQAERLKWQNAKSGTLCVGPDYNKL